MYTKPLKNTGLNVKAGKNGRSIRTRIETLWPCEASALVQVVRTEDP